MAEVFGLTFCNNFFYSFYSMFIIKKRERKQHKEAKTAKKIRDIFYHCVHLDEGPKLFVLFDVYIFDNCIAPVRFLPWEIWVAFPRESQL